MWNFIFYATSLLSLFFLYTVWISKFRWSQNVSSFCSWGVEFDFVISARHKLKYFRWSGTKVISSNSSKFFLSFSGSSLSNSTSFALIVSHFIFVRSFFPPHVLIIQLETLNFTFGNIFESFKLSHKHIRSFFDLWFEAFFDDIQAMAPVGEVNVSIWPLLAHRRLV